MKCSKWLRLNLFPLTPPGKALTWAIHGPFNPPSRKWSCVRSFNRALVNMLKKNTLLLSWQTLSPTSKTSSSHPVLLAHPQNQQHRVYAIVSGGHSKHNHGSLRWPEVTSANAIPTPYQIFNQKKGSPYSKKRFYELVKLYHPDRHDFDNSCDGISYEIKLERYRLVVAANEILSDPVKRGAYDCYGAGWNGQPNAVHPRDSSGSPSPWGGRGWGGGPRGPSQNATWYQRDSEGPQEPKFTSNSAFVGLILTFAVIGGIGQATRAGSYGISFVEQRDALHSNISRDLVRRRKETMNAYGSREERINHFLRQRDTFGYGITDPKHEVYRKLLPTTPETCSCEDVKSRQLDVCHQKRNTKDG